MTENRVLVTGGAGYIGSHTVLSLVQSGYTPCVLDNLCNGSMAALERVAELAGVQIPLIEADVGDANALRRVFAEYAPQAVIHFAGLKSVAEATARPLLYYRNNVSGSVALLEAMQQAGCRTLVFSSSATVYGDPAFLPYTEAHPIRPMNPYGHTKAMVEQIIADCCEAWPQLSAVNLRYFNPVGAHESGRIGEDPQGVPNNLMPYLAQVAVGRRDYLNVFGTDWPTPDGTGVRDYVHVMDLAEAHVAALRFAQGQVGLQSINVGTGRGTSVLELIAAFSAACGKQVPWQGVARRAGDLAMYYADASCAEKILGWKATRSVEQMCADTWRWQQANPQGYGT